MLSICEGFSILASHSCRNGKREKHFTEPVSVESLSLIICRDLHSSRMFWSVTGHLVPGISG